VTRCLDCGSDRIADQCPSCGLTSAAAELVLRRRLIIRTAWFLAGALVFISASQVFPPLDLDAMLIFVGVVFFVGLGLAIVIDQRARQRGDVEIFKRLFFGLVPLPWIVAVMLFSNGKFDTAPTKRISARVVSRFNMPGLLFKSRRLVVTSWREGHEVERLPVGTFDFDRFRVGDDLFVGEQPGLLGIPWVLELYRDDSSPRH
jgi:hypothetical protein